MTEVPSSRRSTAPTRKPRTIVLCFDGTSNQYNTYNTNVVKLYSCLKKDKTDEQICYYQSGVGTYFQPGVVSPLFHKFAVVLDLAIAWYLSAHVMDGYKFLMQNYNTGDKVCMFGFSRGAYTARALAGMLHKVGLLSKDNDPQIPFAYSLYKSQRPENSVLAEGFKRTFCRAVPIEFLGVWDTVASVGVFTTRTLPFVTTNTTIRTFRHALSLDEHRAKFRASYYHRPVPRVEERPSRAQTIVNGVRSRMSSLNLGVLGRIRRKYADGGFGTLVHDALTVQARSAGRPDIDGPATDSVFTTDVKEVWFAGSHTDVGGGAVPDSDPYALANIPLRWMIREAMRAQAGILWENSAFDRWGIPKSIADIFQLRGPTADGAVGGGGQVQTSMHDYLVTSPMEEEEGKKVGPPEKSSANSGINYNLKLGDAERDARDAAQEVSDQLKVRRLWWLLECIPTKYSWQSSVTSQWVREWSLHLGQGRGVPDNPLFHESVKMRMENEDVPYTPRALYKRGTETYVV
ncbi:hypothetical protein OF83DRAFT_1119936 [Amylostereum chailletii]|nr:hypothetical protein OF83DRAFT_1119936 [Amylostereum chailletii]